ncbi:MAG: QueT transporter family protein [Clostridia bacterium]|nr:QueT transporter family protein [Clostridia bacterium]
MQKLFTTKRLCRAGVIAALYVALTYAFGGLSFGGFLQIRPAEALCILPLFYIEAIPALYVGCMLSNLTSPFFLYDVFLGSLATLLAAILSYLVGVFLKKRGWKLFLGGLFPVLVNAFVIPLIIVFLCGDTGGKETLVGAYFFFVGSMLVTQSLWVYGLGIPLYFAIERSEKQLRE